MARLSSRPLSESAPRRPPHRHGLKEHLQAFLMAYSFAKRLKTRKGLTPHEYICKCWQKEPERFTVDPCQHTLGLNTRWHSERGGSAMAQEALGDTPHTWRKTSLEPGPTC
jgi:hypothetical protein